MTSDGRAGLRRAAAWLVVLLAALAPAAASAAGPIKAVATFSILGDLVGRVGGTHVAVTNLVGPNADAHSFSPTPEDARQLAAADIVFVNGLGFEGWIERLIRASGTKAPVVVASQGAKVIAGSRDHAGHDHGDHDHGSHDAADVHADPHAWQSVANVKLYVAAIRDGLSRIDAAHAADYAENARAYSERLDALDAEIRTTIAEIPEARRRVITTHDSFGYYTQAYGLRFIAPQGLSTDSEAGPADVARIIRQIRQQKIPAVFLESIADPRLMQQIARESGAKVGGKVFSDALSGVDGPATSYIDLMRANLRAFREALG